MQSTELQAPTSTDAAAVTRGEIEATEQILRSIDRNNAVLAASSQWLLVWVQVRALAVKLERASAEVRESVAAPFQRLLEHSFQLGWDLDRSLREAQLPPDQVAAVTGCTPEGFHACLLLLSDLRALHSGPPLPREIVEGVWRKCA